MYGVFSVFRSLGCGSAIPGILLTSLLGPGKVVQGKSAQARWRNCKPCNGSSGTCLAVAAPRCADSGKCALCQRVCARRHTGENKKTGLQWRDRSWNQAHLLSMPWRAVRLTHLHSLVVVASALAFAMHAVQKYFPAKSARGSITSYHIILYHSKHCSSRVHSPREHASARLKTPGKAPNNIVAPFASNIQ